MWCEETYQTRSPHVRRGFTLFEVMLALSVLAVAIMGFGSLFMRSANMNNFDRDRVAACKVAHHVMERLLAMDNTECLTTSGKTFTQAINDNLVVVEDLQGDEEYDRGLPANELTQEEMAMYQQDYEVKASSGPATSLVTVAPVQWSTRVLQIDVEVPELGVRVSTYKYE